MEGLNSNTNDVGDRIRGDGLDADSAAAANEEKIFRTSLWEMFREPQSSKTDACAVFCCGVYLWQRNQDILMRERRKDEESADGDDSFPSSICSTIAKRPLDILFLLLLAVAITIWSFDTNNLLSNIGSVAVCLLILLATWKVFRFQQARKRFRRQLAITEYYRRQNSDNPEDESGPDLAVFLEEHKQEIHGQYEDEGNCTRPCGMCAIAQESRHLREVIPTTIRPGLWQRDYITMQPWMEYYPSILRLRLSNQFHCIPHFKALSRLSRRLLISGASVLLFVTLMFLLPVRFPKWQLIIVSLCVAKWALEIILAFCFNVI